ncbi:hypothetical protein BU16DRAFT_554058 [Lophium mytilinum]|uniref:Uncharacterized protein n=1 Tax=Lophium mytilinum TaxID=390894 RepID=A0A6A6RCA2_9PEZI|nr:hypothetical protein BU16DRAFT_554058 [Lophium mytilinum]
MEQHSRSSKSPLARHPKPTPQEPSVAPAHPLRSSRASRPEDDQAGHSIPRTSSSGLHRPHRSNDAPQTDSGLTGIGEQHTSPATAAAILYVDQGTHTDPFVLTPSTSRLPPSLGHPHTPSREWNAIDGRRFLYAPQAPTVSPFTPAQVTPRAPTVSPFTPAQATPRAPTISPFTPTPGDVGFTLGLPVGQSPLARRANPSPGLRANLSVGLRTSQFPFAPVFLNRYLNPRPSIPTRPRPSRPAPRAGPPLPSLTPRPDFPGSFTIGQAFPRSEALAIIERCAPECANRPILTLDDMPESMTTIHARAYFSDGEDLIGFVWKKLFPWQEEEDLLWGGAVPPESVRVEGRRVEKLVDEGGWSEWHYWHENFKKFFERE